MQKERFQQIEFIAMMAALMSIVALALDAILPALDLIGITIGTTETADNQLLVTMMFLGIGIGPLFFGPWSDSVGRKPIVYIGFAIFIVASLICIFATSVPVMIIGRILQGIGLSAPRTISIAMIRDTYSGDYMARIMSFVTVVFILIPVVAPLTGKAILNHYNWQAIFYVQLLFSIFICFWFWQRQGETLKIQERNAFSFPVLQKGFLEVIRYKTTMGYTIISGCITGSFLVYLSTSQQIFEQQYGLKEEFPYIFGLIAIAIGAAIFLNGTLVLKFGMQKLASLSLISYCIISIVYVFLFYGNENPNIIILLLFFTLQFFAVGFLFGNLRALAMQPVGHIAGIGAAITGFISTFMAVPISTFIGRFVTTSVLPLFIGFSICSAISVLILWYLTRKKAA